MTMEEYLKAAQQRAKEIQQGTRPHNTKNIMMGKYIKACEQLGIKPNIRQK